MGCMSGPQPSKQASGSTAKTESQTGLLDEMIAEYKKTLGQGQDLFPGEMVAPFTPLQQGLFGTMGQYTSQVEPLDTSTLPLYSETQDAIQKLLSGEFGAQSLTPQQTEEFFNRAVAEPARFSFQDIQKPLIREEYAGPGFSGSARAQAVTRQGQDLERELTEGRAKLEFNVLQQNQAIEQQKAQTALATLPAAFQLQSLPEDTRTQRINDMVKLFLAASPQQLYEQALIDEEINRFAAAKRITDPEELSILLALLNMDFSTSYGKATGAEEAGMGYSLMGLALAGLVT